MQDLLISKLLPQLPLVRNEIVLQDEWTETTVGERFLLCDNGHGDKILIFGTLDNLRHLAAAPTRYADRTFYTCPRLLKQIQAANEVTIIQYATGGVCATKRRKYRSIDERIVQLKERLQRGDIDIVRICNVYFGESYSM
ncbi:hypothetical protein KUTeg_009741 [Tegillarca granosa]|uniref:Uncharacterized protein n=1 Tax=Tegillarca granosa TaxID=220873 RepID=A0ABQ9F4R7_TEGGR|nr:hypothetical protein KUTeg_009741 [Tegillarca granosa]